jgi:hypothetical protein
MKHYFTIVKYFLSVSLSFLAECHHAEHFMLNVIMLSIFMLNVVMLSIFMLNVVMLSILMLNFVMLNVFMLSVVASLACLGRVVILQPGSIDLKR